ncbi:hypothetical protein AFM11_20985 [Mycolicibacterium wolinskyi]|uniref:Uncharacterized protein n=1 Tax=Mycolicibacterium wolinskyi TaxID=59750 RepID=A0A132PIY2_9MYCO|nr:hypothetical protein AFM11_20985 [Mycolicibacterium wolinskyi]
MVDLVVVLDQMGHMSPPETVIRPQIPIDRLINCERRAERLDLRAFAGYIPQVDYVRLYVTMYLLSDTLATQYVLRAVSDARRACRDVAPQTQDHQQSIVTILDSQRLSAPDLPPRIPSVVKRKPLSGITFRTERLELPRLATQPVPSSAIAALLR